MTPETISSKKLRLWLQGNRLEALDLLALGVSIWAVYRVHLEFPAMAALCALVVSVLVPFRRSVRTAGLRGEFLAALPRRLAAIAATAVVLRFWLDKPLGYLWFGAVWPAAAWAFSFDWTRMRIRSAAVNEAARVVLLAFGTLWLMRGFDRPTLNGTADSLWYATTLKDMVAQVRSGLFPVWVGQSVYQFNGSICPVRVAPAFNYLGALLDALTFGSLGTFALQNLLINVVAICAIASAYLSLRALLPNARWLAAGLAALYLTCPGVLGLAYNTDLYMSWTAVPLVPLVWFATVRSFQNRGETGTMVLLGAALGLSWWCHSPTALWSTLLAGAAQIVRAVADRPKAIAWKGVLLGAAAYGAIAAYPVGSMLLFAPPGMRAESFARSVAGVIVYFLKQTFPATILPLSPKGLEFSDFQLGYSVWAVLIVCLLAIRRRWRPESGVPLVSAAVLAVMLLPVPGLTWTIWTAVPAILRNTAGNWAASRLCLPIASATVFGAAAFASSDAVSGFYRRLLAGAVLAGCVWSSSEAAKFANGSTSSARLPDSAADLLRPENVQITRFSYSMFPYATDTFTHGVTDPEMENYLLSREALARVGGNIASALDSGKLLDEGDFRLTPHGPRDSISVDRKFRIVPGRSYLLGFTFSDPDQIHGVLQLAGDHFFREYALPEYGNPRSFGAGGEHATAVSIWTTAGPEDLTVQFIPDTPFGEEVAPSVAHVRLLSYNRDDLPVRVDSWMPYRARVQSPCDAWLKTPRMFQAGYAALVNGRSADLLRSPDGALCVAVPGGLSAVELAYRPPMGLALLFWGSAAGLVATAAFGALRLVRRQRGTPLREPPQGAENLV